MPERLCHVERRTSIISTSTSKIQFQSYFCRGTTNTSSAKCMKGWITGTEAIARHIFVWHQFTNIHTMEIAYECPCSCPGAAFATMGDMLLHISQEHPQRLSKWEKGEWDPPPDSLEGDTEDADVESEEDGVTMVMSRHPSRDERPLRNKAWAQPDERKDSAKDVNED